MDKDVAVLAPSFLSYPSNYHFRTRIDRMEREEVGAAVDKEHLVADPFDSCGDHSKLLNPSFGRRFPWVLAD